MTIKRDHLRPGRNWDQEESMRKFFIKPSFSNKGNKTPETPYQMPETVSVLQQPTAVSFSVHGMWSITCVSNIQDILAKQPGVTFVHVDYSGERVCICYNPERNSIEQLKRVIDDIGYIIRFIDP